MPYQPTGKPAGRPISDKVRDAADLLAKGAGVRATMRIFNLDWRQIVRAKAINAARTEAQANER